MLVIGVLAAVVLVVVLTLPVADRVARVRAEAAAARYLAQPFGAPATVRVTHRPFLPQAVRGVYRRVEVVGVLRLGALERASLVAHLTNVHLPTRQLLGGRTREVACERVHGRVLVAYEEVAAASTIPGLALRFDGGDLQAAAAVPVPGLNQLVRLRGVAELRHVETGTVWLRVRGVSVVGVAVPSIIWNQILPVLNVPIHLPELPYGLRIDELRPTAEGLVVEGSAAAVVFRAPDARPRPS